AAATQETLTRSPFREPLERVTSHWLRRRSRAAEQRSTSQRRWFVLPEGAGRGQICPHADFRSADVVPRFEAPALGCLRVHVFVPAVPVDLVLWAVNHQ